MEGEGEDGIEYPWPGPLGPLLVVIVDREAHTVAWRKYKRMYAKAKHIEDKGEREVAISEIETAWKEDIKKTTRPMTAEEIKRLPSY